MSSSTSTTKKFRFTQKFLLFVQFFTFIGSTLSILAWYISPSDAGWLGLFGLSFMLWTFLNVLFLFYWITQFKWPWVISAILLLASIPQIPGIFTVKFGESDFEQEPVRLMTYNVHYWKNQNWTNLDEVPKTMASYIAEEEPDILCLQEYMINKYTPEIDLPYKKIVPTNEDGDFGLAIYSFYPIVASGKIDYTNPYKSYRSFVWADILIKTDTIRVFNVHLVTTGLRPEKYKSLKEIDHTEEVSFKEEMKDMAGHLMRTFKIRASQIDEVMAAVRTSPHKVILAGDFNDTPGSYTYATASENLKDSFRLAGKGFGNTYTKFKLAPLRIDHVFVDPSIGVNHYHIKKQKESDHNPVIMDLYLHAF